MKFKILNLQSTGLGADNEGPQRAVEVGIITVVNGKIEGKTRFHTLINPERSVQAAASKLHGHTQSSLSDEPLFSEVADDIIHALEGADCLVVHSHHAVSLLNEEFRALGDPNKYPDVGLLFGGHLEQAKVKGEMLDKVKDAKIVDIYQLCVRYFGKKEAGSYTLESLCKHYDIKQYDSRSGEYHADKRDDRVYQILVALVKDIAETLKYMKATEVSENDDDYRYINRLQRIADKVGDKLTDKGIKLEDFIELEASKALSLPLMRKPKLSSKHKLSDTLPKDSPLSSKPPKLLRRNALTPKQSEEFAENLDKMLRSSRP